MNFFISKNADLNHVDSMPIKYQVCPVFCPKKDELERYIAWHWEEHNNARADNIPSIANCHQDDQMTTQTADPMNVSDGPLNIPNTDASTRDTNGSEKNTIVTDNCTQGVSWEANMEIDS